MIPTAFRSNVMLATIAACAVLAVLPLVLSNWMIFLIALALAKGAVVLGVVMLLRGGLISFGHASFFGIGAYTVTLSLVYWNLTPWLGIPLGMVVGGVAAFLPLAGESTGVEFSTGRGG